MRWSDAFYSTNQAANQFAINPVLYIFNTWTRALETFDIERIISRVSSNKTNPRDLAKKRVPTLMLIGGYYQVSSKNEQLKNMMEWFNIKNTI